MEVKIKDRDFQIEILRMVLNICEFGVDYTQADLIYHAVEEAKTKKGKFDLKDGIMLHHSWKNKWEEYFKELNQKK